MNAKRNQKSKTETTETNSSAAPAATEKKPYGSRKNAARELYQRPDTDRSKFVAGCIAESIGVTRATAETWWQQFKSGKSPLTARVFGQKPAAQQPTA